VNILPLVTAFLLIFSFASYTMLRERVASDKQEWGYTGFFSVERGLQSTLQKRAFKNAPSTSKQNQKTVASKEKRKASKYHSRRLKTPPSDLGKLNIYALFEKNGTNQRTLLYHTAARLIKILYGHTPFYKNSGIKDLEYRLLDAMLARGKGTSLSAIFPVDPQLNTLYYKMLKGTPHFELQIAGYPPLGDYLYIGAGKKKEIYFCFASLPLLQALLGEPIAEEICAEEKKLWEEKGKALYLGKGELWTVISKKQHTPMDLGALEELLSFEKKPDTLKTLQGVDQQSKVLLRRRC
jgi:hypothetical protein